MRSIRWGAAVLALLASGCSMRPSEERALKDLQVGQVEAGGVTFTVEDGLAVVRQVAPGTLTLWGSAPAFHVRAVSSAGAPEAWTVVVRNAMPDAELSAVAAGELLLVEDVPGVVPTVKTWRVQVPAGAEVRLTVAPPEWDQPKPFRFAALADVQEALPRVGDIYRRINADPTLRFIYFSGDLTQRGSVAELEEFQSRLLESRIPLFATLGNHELITPDPRYHEYFGRGNLHFTFHGAHFTMIDSGNGSLDPRAEEMLDGWLAAGRDAVHILGTHIPIVDPIGVRNGAFASRNEAAALLAKLANGKLDLTLYGHVHSYYSFSNAGIPSFISGGGGAIPEQFDGVGRHFLAVEVDPSQGVRTVSLVRVD
ncbi:metallophosphoesterase [Archangium lansingense]|uniref:Metallophosphoesterase n=1 Tax=Archangium lansingense TaxID=2995310 RepID=A0ABT3ZV31_9BACT|nr:metallophosphoesterase [Archangium lansinium]MCY1073255.1 metallophosphoesterase [Archangium lansinium]